MSEGIRVSDPKPIAPELQAFIQGWRNTPEHACRVCAEVIRSREENPICWECEEAARRERIVRERARAVLAGIDPRWHSVTLADYECPPGDARALALVRQWDGASGLYLHGAPGSGKSHLAFARVRALLHEGRRVFIAEWASLLRRFRATYDGRGPETEESILAEMARADLVFLDDVLTSRPTEWAVDQLWAIVQDCYQTKRPLLMTCNYGLPQLAARIGSTEADRIVSRLAEMCERVEVRADDYRMKRGARC